ncbi:hypothetical protein CKAH01_13750 [Colletotrichum kahawae]|uniref:Uncharacterized protein n=1 Tax=Colletotrichum kahawae TaxID=34407 RepID=A0AAE0DB55_COLKA|nr:hypothetical protein CKAH01_13750 [Colletotrichum kahawae]
MGAGPTGQDEPRDAATAGSKKKKGQTRKSLGAAPRVAHPSVFPSTRAPNISHPCQGPFWGRTGGETPCPKLPPMTISPFVLAAAVGPLQSQLKWVGEWKRTGRFEHRVVAGLGLGKRLFLGVFFPPSPPSIHPHACMFRCAKERLWICCRNSGLTIRFEKETRSIVMRPIPYRPPLTRALLLERRMMALGDAGRPPTTSPTPDADSPSLRTPLREPSHLHLFSHLFCIIILFRMCDLHETEQSLTTNVNLLR